ncbi:AGAP012246-PA [Anopheles gambiae str. PEST]|uniref:AGAP012246-PA n=1 Tax=Anopheles gambiae TaxID=7165 RepID=Q7Q037_ANOGA|nr:AGAP012246-PA [Anopheles gambiae str. PEST]
MAVCTSSMTSDSGGAPENFHITYSHDGDDIGGIVVGGEGTLRCPLCGAHRRHFHCKSCIRHGDFLHTAVYCQLPERFGEKQQRLRNLRTANATLESKGSLMLEKLHQAGRLAGEIKQRSDKADIIRKTIELKRIAIEELRLKQRHLGDAIRKLRITLPRYDDKVKTLSEFVAGKLEESEHRKARLAAVQERLRQRKRDQVQQLVRIIFPITQTIASRSSLTGSSSTASSGSSACGGATRTAYVRGQWILQDSFGEVQHVIVAPALPGTGNYSAYNEWATGGGDGGGAVASASSTAASTMEASASPAKVGSHNPAHTIAAALTYTSQLVALLGYYLDVRLPYRVSYADFCTTTLSEAQFARKVARLNADIVFLCHTQGCRLNDMNPTHTLENLLCLLKSPELGHCGPTDRNSCLSDSMEQLLMQNIGEDSDSEDETTLHQEWEAVPSNLSPVTTEPPYPPMMALDQRRTTIGHTGLHYHHLQQPTGAAATSLMTSAFASVSSFWKGWTGK